ncbi:hypothetical protein [Halosegnis marinus]|nr:hypothetical protein [Halosegnis sp. DT85]
MKLRGGTQEVAKGRGSAVASKASAISGQTGRRLGALGTLLALVLGMFVVIGEAQPLYRILEGGELPTRYLRFGFAGVLILGAAWWLNVTAALVLAATVWLGFMLNRPEILTAINNPLATPWVIAGVLIALIPTWWALDIYTATKRAPTVERFGEKFVDRLTNLAESVLTGARLATLGALTIGFLAASQAGILTGELFGLFEEAPLVASNLFGIGLGFLALGGTVTIPVLGPVTVATLGAQLFLFIAAFVFAIAVGVRYG